MRRVLYWILYLRVIPHLYKFSRLDDNQKRLILSDVEEMNYRLKKQEKLGYYLLCWPPYRNLYYSRIGYKGYLLKLFLPEYKYFIINCPRWGGHAFVLNHPYGTIINAESIGDHFTCCQLTTIGNKNNGQNDLVPIIGNNVTIGANASVIGKVVVSDDVVIGAGSVVVKDVPEGAVVVGNPGRIIRFKNGSKKEE